jgi:alkylation response protein AidB-like acyl-CoA dehydrogenase
MLPVPEELGGLGGTLLDFVMCQERLAQGCASTTLCINMHIFALGSLIENLFSPPPSSTPQQAGDMSAMKAMLSTLTQSKLLIGGGFTEAEIGGNWGFPTTTAIRQDRDGVPGFVINGLTQFSSLAPVLDLAAVNTTTTGPDGQPVIGLFVVPRNAGDRDRRDVGYDVDARDCQPRHGDQGFLGARTGMRRPARAWRR